MKIVIVTMLLVLLACFETNPVHAASQQTPEQQFYTACFNSVIAGAEQALGKEVLENTIAGNAAMTDARIQCQGIAQACVNGQVTCHIDENGHVIAEQKTAVDPHLATMSPSKRAEIRKLELATANWDFDNADWATVLKHWHRVASKPATAIAFKQLVQRLDAGTDLSDYREIELAQINHERAYIRANFPDLISQLKSHPSCPDEWLEYSRQTLQQCMDWSYGQTLN